jgi:hypothetical protein
MLWMWYVAIMRATVLSEVSGGQVMTPARMASETRAYSNAGVR